MRGDKWGQPRRLPEPAMDSYDSARGGRRLGRARLPRKETRVHNPVVVGICLVRNAADIVRVNVLHHLSLGLDRIVLVDNMSTDGTDLVLQELSRDSRVRWFQEDGPHPQARVFTRLAREAYHEGADWVLPIDIDEFWHVRRGSFKSVLAKSESVAIRVQVINFVQRRSQLESTPDALLHMTWRVPQPAGSPEEALELVGSGKIAHVEARYPAKWIVRPTATVEIAHGNHHLAGIVGGLEDSDEIICLHAPLRSRAALYAKAIHGRRVEEAGGKPGESWHVRRFRRLAEEDRMEQEWAANSYEDGFLNVFGAKHPLVYDPTLKEAVRPFLSPSMVESFLSKAKRVAKILS